MQAGVEGFQFAFPNFNFESTTYAAVLCHCKKYSAVWRTKFASQSIPGKSSGEFSPLTSQVLPAQPTEGLQHTYSAKVQVLNKVVL